MNFLTAFRIFLKTAYIFGIAVIIVALPTSKYILSIGQFIILGAWILERVNIEKTISFYTSRSLFFRISLGFPYALVLMAEGIGKGFQEFFRNKPAMVVASLYLVHILGLLFTFDYGYAFKDLRTKLPILALPLILSTSDTFYPKAFYRYLIIFSVTLVVVTIINFIHLANFQYIDIRDISKHVSHIIFGLLISLGIFVQAFFIFKKSIFPRWYKIIPILMLGWFMFYLIVSISITGVAVTLLTTMILFFIYLFWLQGRWLKAALFLLILFMVAGSFFYVRSIIQDYYYVEPVDFKKLEPKTSRGNPYEHNRTANLIENGHYVWIYVQFEELKDAWNNRSGIPYDSLDLKGQKISFTLIRFLTSKGLRKDADGVYQLSQKEIQAIEKGEANVVYMERFSIRGRIYSFLMGYETVRRSGNPTGSSLMQRLEFWRASLGIIRNHWLLGVGTGDLNEAFKWQYEIMQTKLSPDQRWRSHNQYLSFLIAFGVPGLAWFLFSLVYPGIKRNGFKDYFFLVFFIIMMLSMLTEDTLESQAGVTFAYFYYTFFLFGRKKPDTI